MKNNLLILEGVSCFKIRFYKLLATFINKYGGNICLSVNESSCAIRLSMLLSSHRTQWHKNKRINEVKRDI